jgi:hypothetical protein
MGLVAKAKGRSRVHTRAALRHGVRVGRHVPQLACVSHSTAHSSARHSKAQHSTARRRSRDCAPSGRAACSCEPAAAAPPGRSDASRSPPQPAAAAVTSTVAASRGSCKRRGEGGSGACCVRFRHPMADGACGSVQYRACRRRRERNPRAFVRWAQPDGLSTSVRPRVIAASTGCKHRLQAQAASTGCKHRLVGSTRDPPASWLAPAPTAAAAAAAPRRQAEAQAARPACGKKGGQWGGTRQTALGLTTSQVKAASRTYILARSILTHAYANAYA